MKESLLHYLWQYQLFQTTELFTTKKESILVKFVGEFNQNTGPDFIGAQVKIGNQLWAGNVEIHVKSSDWYVHHHETDANYNNVVLHVVWEHDVEVFNSLNQPIPVLELQSFISKSVLKNYDELFRTNNKWINCENSIEEVSSLVYNSWIERLFFERLEQKSFFIIKCLESVNYDWEAVLFQLLARNFGLKINAEAFFEMAKQIDFGIVRKESVSIERIESLLFGELGMLTEQLEDAYYKKLQKEYVYQKSKYGLEALKTPQVQFFRLRPINFPTIRISQLANLYTKNSQLFSELMALNNLSDFYNLFSIRASDYWKTHYTFEKQSPKRIKRLSKSFIDLLIINTIIPLRFVYQKYIGKPDDEGILRLISSLKPEKNTVISKFEMITKKPENAMQSQALLYLKQAYCNEQKCLQCAIGNHLMRTNI